MTPLSKSLEPVGIIKDLLGLVERLLSVIDIAGLDSLLDGAVCAAPVGLVFVESELLNRPSLRERPLKFCKLP